MSIHWDVLERLRTVFLEGTGGQRDYWGTEADLVSYDATFAQRIGWKWDYVLGELQARGWRPPGGGVLDWGCGTGIAARAFLDWYGRESRAAVSFWDRSALARSFAATKAATKYPGLPVDTTRIERPDLVLLSHVLTELGSGELESLLSWLPAATSVIWVEPGSAEVSRQLVEVREALRARFQVVAPCTHSGVCGLLAPGNERHWCHHFAPSPPGVFTDPFWGRFARMTGVDLRSLPLSFLVLDQRAPPALPAGTVRVLGRPRVHKAHAAVQTCAEEGVAEWELRRRDLPEAFDRWQVGEGIPLEVWEREGDRVVSTRPLIASA